jgi:hypothetical protein
MWYECLHPQHLSSIGQAMSPAVEYDPAAGTGGFHVVIDSTYYRGFYATSVADGDYLIFILRLGPRGSFWNIQPVAHTGTGQGEVKFEWGQTSYGEDAPSDGLDDAGLADPENALSAVDDLPNTGPTWYNAAGNNWDLTVAGSSPGKINSHGTYSQMRIMGNVGDVLSANGTFNGDYASEDMNGGPGIWYLKMTAVTHPVEISSVLVSRQTVFDYSAI